MPAAAAKVGSGQGDIANLELVELPTEAFADAEAGRVRQAEGAGVADWNAIDEDGEVRELADQRVVMPVRVEDMRDDSRETGVRAIADDETAGARLRHEME